MQPEDEEHYMEWDTAQRILRVGMVISFLVAALGIVGEFLGWWNDVGELLTTTGTVGGLVLGATSIIGNASRAQVDGVAQSLEGVNAGLEGVNAGVAQANETLGQIDGDLDKLDQIEAALVAEDGETSRLDVVQTELDRQTGVLDRQVGLLTEIRDRL